MALEVGKPGIKLPDRQVSSCGLFMRLAGSPHAHVTSLCAIREESSSSSPLATNPMGKLTEL